MDWAATLRKESLRSWILRSDELARRYGIAETAVGNALRDRNDGALSSTSRGEPDTDYVSMSRYGRSVLVMLV